ncbi:MFS transporter [Nocardia sp. NPDC003482]
MPSPAPGRWIALAAIALATLTIGLDVTVLTVALPTLSLDLHAGNSALQWFSAAYTLMLAGVMLPAGVLGDKYGRKRLLLGALVLFGIASAACAYADTVGQLIAARAVLGLAAAIMIPLSIAVLPALFADPEERDRAIAVWVAAAALGLPLGPVLGGFLLNHFWWGSVFLINVPLVVVGAAAVAAFVPEQRGAGAVPVDYVGAVLSSLGLLSLTYGFIKAGQDGWGAPLALGPIAAGVVVLAVFVLWARRAAHPLIDLALFRSRGFCAGSLFIALGMFILYGLLFVLPQYFQAVSGADAFGSGLRLIPMMAGLVIGTRVADGIRRRRGARPVIALGFAMLACAAGLGAGTSVGTAYWIIGVWTALVGAGMGFVMPTALGTAVDSVSAERAGSGSAVIQAYRQVGGTIGAAVLPSLVASRYRIRLGNFDIPPIRDNVSAGVAAARIPELLALVRTAFVSGMDLMLWVCTGVCVAALILAVWLTPRRRKPSATTESVAQDTSN